MAHALYTTKKLLKAHQALGHMYVILLNQWMNPICKSLLQIIYIYITATLEYMDNDYSEGLGKQTLETSIILKQGNVNYPRLQGIVDFGSNFVSIFICWSQKRKKSLN